MSFDVQSAAARIEERMRRIERRARSAALPAMSPEEVRHETDCMVALLRGAMSELAGAGDSFDALCAELKSRGLM